MNLDTYLQRINYNGSRQPTLSTLRQLHRAHLFAIPYENWDIHLGRKLILDLDHIYHKIVEEGRGGWCYEMNGLFAWALSELGFNVTMLGSLVGKPAQGGLEGDQDHLVLLVQLDQPWLVDVGFGTAFIEPLLLSEGEYQQNWMIFRLERDEEKWFFHNHQHGGKGYGFTLLPRQLAGFTKRCHELQTLPESRFVRSTLCYRPTTEGIASLRDAILKHCTGTGVTEEEIDSLARYQEIFDQVFGLDVALASQLWDGVQARHVLLKQEMEKVNQN